jgi:hypothetical protein
MLSNEKEAIALTERITLAEYQRAESELRTEQERVGFIVHAVPCHKRCEPVEGIGEM